MHKKIISVTNVEQVVPKILHIGPDPHFQQRPRVPCGKIPNMTLCYIEGSHYDLITSRKIKMTKSIWSPKDIDEKGLEFETLKVENKEIKTSRVA